MIKMIIKITNLLLTYTLLEIETLQPNVNVFIVDLLQCVNNSVVMSGGFLIVLSYVIITML